MPLYEQAKLVDAGFLSVQLQERESLAQLGRGRFGTAGERFQHRIEGLYGASVIELAIVDFAQVELCLTGQIVERIVAEHILELGCGNVVAGGVIVAHAGLKSLVERRRLIG